MGIADAIGDTYEQSKSEGTLMIWMNLLNMAVLLSANLGVMNLLPSSCAGWRKAGISGGRSDPEKTGKPSGRRHDPFCRADAFDGVDGYRYV